MRKALSSIVMSQQYRAKSPNDKNFSGCLAFLEKFIDEKTNEEISRTPKKITGA